VKRWRESPAAREPAFLASEVERVRKWRAKHRDYWKKKTRDEVALRNLASPVFIGVTEVSDEKSGAAKPAAPQAPSLVETKNRTDELESKFDALRNFVLDGFTGMISHLSGDRYVISIAPVLRNLTMLGQEIRMGRVPEGEKHASQTSVVPGTPAPRPGTVQLDRPPPGAG